VCGPRAVGFQFADDRVRKRHPLQHAALQAQVPLGGPLTVLSKPFLRRRRLQVSQQHLQRPQVVRRQIVDIVPRHDVAGPIDPELRRRADVLEEDLRPQHVAQHRSLVERIPRLAPDTRPGQQAPAYLVLGEVAAQLPEILLRQQPPVRIVGDEHHMTAGDRIRPWHELAPRNGRAGERPQPREQPLCRTDEDFVRSCRDATADARTSIRQDHTAGLSCRSTERRQPRAAVSRQIDLRPATIFSTCLPPVRQFPRGKTVQDSS
jgi:hypothetical protein